MFLGRGEEWQLCVPRQPGRSKSGRNIGSCIQSTLRKTAGIGKPSTTRKGSLSAGGISRAPNAERKRRRDFYLLNGYRETGVFLSYLGVDYEVFCMDRSFQEDDFKEMMKTIHIKGFSPHYFHK